MSTCRSVYSALSVCRTNIDDAMYMCSPSMWSVFGRGVGSGVGGVYDRRTLGLYMLSVSSSSFALPLPFAVPFGLRRPSKDVTGRDHEDFVGAGAEWETSGVSSEETSPVEKKSGRVCCKMYMARPTCRQEREKLG